MLVTASIELEELRLFQLLKLRIFMELVFALKDVLRENRSRLAPGAEAALDQGSIAFESGFLFHQSAYLGFAVAHRL